MPLPSETTDDLIRYFGNTGLLLSFPPEDGEPRHEKWVHAREWGRMGEGSVSLRYMDGVKSKLVMLGDGSKYANYLKPWPDTGYYWVTPTKDTLGYAVYLGRRARHSQKVGFSMETCWIYNPLESVVPTNFSSAMSAPSVLPETLALINKGNLGFTLEKALDHLKKKVVSVPLENREYCLSDSVTPEHEGYCLWYRHLLVGNMEPNKGRITVVVPEFKQEIFDNFNKVMEVL